MLARLSVVFAALILLATAASAGPTAEWKGTTPTLICAANHCQIVSPPVDDSTVTVGTGKAQQVRLVLKSEEPLKLQIGLDSGVLMTKAGKTVHTKWLPAPDDGTLPVKVLDSRYTSSGVIAGAQFALTAQYR